MFLRRATKKRASNRKKIRDDSPEALHPMRVGGRAGKNQEKLPKVWASQQWGRWWWWWWLIEVRSIESEQVIPGKFWIHTHTHTRTPTHLAREVNWLWKASWSEESSVVLVWEEKSCFPSGEWIEPRIFQQQQQRRKKPPQRRRSDVVIRSSLSAPRTGDWAPKVTSMWLIWFVTEYCSGTCWEVLCLGFLGGYL